MIPPKVSEPLLTVIVGVADRVIAPVDWLRSLGPE